MDTPVRSDTRTYYCHCLLIHHDQSDGKNHCRKHTEGPDVPFCHECEGRHEGVYDGSTITVTTYMTAEYEESG